MSPPNLGPQEEALSKTNYLRSTIDYIPIYSQKTLVAKIYALAKHYLENLC